ncbi:lmo0937 family membrane protein [Flavobacterium sp.]|uniref:lmo0937 family membrane protein n=1 Tax=Flavobacterium sp. TaxID=239 RepID=UPI0019CC81FF|nr:lmo0937 family membrane protein [Flavobacterium sp.]MBC7439774.1 lmo0937 family membrane protein [Flavobacterium sp.]
MNNLLYTIAVVLLILWAIGYFAYSAGAIIHVLLLIAVIAIILRLIQGRNI